jgi:hypothetical protein
MDLKDSPTVLVIEDSHEDLAAAEWSLKNSEDKFAIGRTKHCRMQKGRGA